MVFIVVMIVGGMVFVMIDEVLLKCGNGCWLVVVAAAAVVVLWE